MILMNQRKTHRNFNVMIKAYTKAFYCLLLLTSIASMTSLIQVQDRFVQATLGNQTLGNQTVLSTNQTAAAAQESVRAGSFGDDRITGTNQDDIIIGLLGSDTINGGEGNDKIQGNEDSDKMYGDGGNDILQGGVGSDQIFGRTGNDVIVGGTDDDYLIGNDDNAGNCEEIIGTETISIG